MEDAIKLSKLQEHYQALQALMLEALGTQEYHLLDKEMDALEYQMDLIVLRMDGYEE